MPSHNGVQYRTHGQAARAAKEQPSQDSTSNEGENAVGKGEGMKGGNIVAVKHNGGPPYHVKHEDGSVTKHDSHEDLMQHLQGHIPGGESESLGEDQSEMDSDYGEGAMESVKSMMG